MSGLRVAVPKGAIFADALAALEMAGLPAGVLRENGRRLIYRAEGTEFIVSRPSDVPVFVEYGAADIGIVGKDVLDEQRPNVVELRDLGTGRCRMILAAPEGRAEDVRRAISHAEVVRVATKFPDTARRYFERIGRQATANRVVFITMDARGFRPMSFGSAEYRGFVTPGLRSTMESAEQATMQAPLHMLAQETGGHAIVNRNEILPALQEAASGRNETGRFFAEFYMARIYSDDAGTLTDHAKAFVLFRKPANENADIDPGDHQRAPFVAKAFIALAGYVVESAARASFAEYVRTNVLAPLGMMRSSFAQPMPAELERAELVAAELKRVDVAVDRSAVHVGVGDAGVAQRRVIGK